METLEPADVFACSFDGRVMAVSKYDEDDQFRRVRMYKLSDATQTFHFFKHIETYNLFQSGLCFVKHNLLIHAPQYSVILETDPKGLTVRYIETRPGSTDLQIHSDGKLIVLSNNTEALVYEYKSGRLRYCIPLQFRPFDCVQLSILNGVLTESYPYAEVFTHTLGEKTFPERLWLDDLLPLSVFQQSDDNLVVVTHTGASLVSKQNEVLDSEVTEESISNVSVFNNGLYALLSNGKIVKICFWYSKRRLFVRGCV